MESEMSSCPFCQREWRRIRYTHERNLDSPERESLWHVICADGHEYRLSSVETSSSSPSRFTIVVPELIDGPPKRVQEAEGPCVGCGKRIRPGEMYLSRPRTRHFGCTAR